MPGKHPPCPENQAISDPENNSGIDCAEQNIVGNGVFSHYFRQNVNKNIRETRENDQREENRKNEPPSAELKKTKNHQREVHDEKHSALRPSGKMIHYNCQSAQSSRRNVEWHLEYTVSQCGNRCTQCNQALPSNQPAGASNCQFPDLVQNHRSLNKFANGKFLWISSGSPASTKCFPGRCTSNEIKVKLVDRYQYAEI